MSVPPATKLAEYEDYAEAFLTGQTKTRFQALVEIAKDMERIKEQQPKTLDWLRANGIVFDRAPNRDFSDWQNVAFWIYTDLCDVESIARAALSGLEP